MEKIIQTELQGVLILKNISHTDNRGIFRELWNKSKFNKFSLNLNFTQDNLSISKKNVLRGLHMQIKPNEQLKYVQVLKGSIIDVAVDLRKDSKTFGQHIKVELNESNNFGLLIPAGFAHGFVSLSDETILFYKCSSKYDKKSEITIKWDDPSLAIEWNVKNPVISLKDSNGISLHQFKNKLT
tara:strand:+ start:122 stop:670 length:549 start_codon:yes stop_codon:yes gene_type:complete